MQFGGREAKFFCDQVDGLGSRDEDLHDLVAQRVGDDFDSFKIIYDALINRLGNVFVHNISLAKIFFSGLNIF